MGGRAILVDSTLGDDSLQIGKKSFGALALRFPVKLDSKSEINALQSIAHVGLGLGYSDPEGETLTEDFTNRAFKNVKLEKRGFSFYYHQKLSKIIFGKPEAFFAIG